MHQDGMQRFPWSSMPNQGRDVGIEAKVEASEITRTNSGQRLENWRKIEQVTSASHGPASVIELFHWGRIK